MGKPSASYSTQTSERGHQARGLDSESRRSLDAKGLLKKKSSKKKTRKRSAAKRAAKSSKDSGDMAELPPRSRRKVPRQSRHFRFPVPLDDKLQDLVEHYDASMIWVVCKLIQEDWVRAKRQERRAAAEGDGAEGADAE